MAANVVNLREGPLPQHMQGMPRPEIVEEEPPADLEQVVEVSEDGQTTITIGDMEAEASPEDAKRDRERFDANLATRIEESVLDALGSYLVQLVQGDEQARAEWEETANLAPKYLGTKLEEPSLATTTDGTVTKAIAQVILEADVTMWSQGRAELLPVGGPVKVKREEPPRPPEPPAMPPIPGMGMPGMPPMAGPGIQMPPPAPEGMGHNGGPPLQGASEFDGDDLADALETDLNHYLTVTDKEYYPDFSKMLFSRYLIGNAFRKVYRCPIKRRPVSIWVKAQDLIVSAEASHLQAAARVTERIPMRQATMRRLMVAGHYRDIELASPSEAVTTTQRAVGESQGVDPTPRMPDDSQYEVYEIYVELGELPAGSGLGQVADSSALERDEKGHKVGFPLPYRVSVEKNSGKVLEIRRNWKQGDELYAARRRYVKYGFIPGIGFYDYGLIHLLGNPTLVATMLMRSTTDAALFSNFPGGVMLDTPSSRMQTTVFRPNPGEFLPVKSGTATDIRQIFMPLPYKPPSAESIALQTKTEGDARRLVGKLEMPVGEGVKNVPVGTMMGYIESISMVPGAVHKDDHMAQQEEFELLRELFVEEPEQLTKWQKRPNRKWTEEMLNDRELVPAADPNTLSEVHRIMRTQALVTAAAMPIFNGIANRRKLWETVCRTLRVDSPSEFTLPEQQGAAPPDPKIVAKQIDLEKEKLKQAGQAANDTRDHQARAAEIAQRGQVAQDANQAKVVTAAIQAGSKEAAEQARTQVALIKVGEDTRQAELDRSLDAAKHMGDRADSAADREAKQATAGAAKKD